MRLTNSWRLLVAGISIFAATGFAYLEFMGPVLATGDVAEVVAKPPETQYIRESHVIKPGDTFAELLVQAGISRVESVKLISAVQDAFDLRKLRVGSELTVTRTTLGMFEALEYSIGPDEKLQVVKDAGSFLADVVEIPGVVRETAVCGTVQGSLFESMERAGERPELALQIAEIFAWDLDFYTDPRAGDEFCFVVEKKEYSDGSPATYRRILAARYVNAGTPYTAVLFPGAEGDAQYFSSDGRSLRSAFLRSPLEFNARVSSHFSLRRFHPVLKTHRPHLGTDYAAPTGTPVRAIGSGRVVFAGRSGGSGNLITLRHPNGYESQYLHLSRILVRRGERVEQGQRIGLVGSTGLATGPHLDLRIRKNGRYLNFESLKPPRDTSISPEQMGRFTVVRDRLAALMEDAAHADIQVANHNVASQN